MEEALRCRVDDFRNTAAGTVGFDVAGFHVVQEENQFGGFWSELVVLLAVIAVLMHRSQPPSRC